MKTFVCSLITLCAAAALVFANGLYFSDLSEKLIDRAGAALERGATPEERVKNIGKIEEYIEDNMFAISLSIGHDETNALLSHVSDAKHFAKSDEGQFFASVEKLKRDVERLRKTECFCLDGLF